jgi:hypothetical protein
MNMDQFIVRPGQKSVEEKTQVINVHRTVKGFYKASIMEADPNGNINEAFSTGWKPNTILNSGLDKIAYMPWSQTFQFCLIGDYPYTGADPVTASYDETMLKRPKRIHAFYLPGQGNCGHAISGSTIRLFRTFDFYKETDNVVYTEVGFKETPAATSLFSKIRFDPTMSLHAGQFMRVSYELRVNLNPATSSVGGFTPNPFPSFTGWTTGSLDKEAIQKVGLCGIDSGSGLSIPIDEGGFCNEPFAPGQLSFGPSYGFVNRYYNGSNVNYYPTASGDTTYETNPFKAVGPLQEFDVGYANIYQILDAGISQSLINNNGKYSGSFQIPNHSTYLPRNYFTTDFIYGSHLALGGENIYQQFDWSNSDNGNPYGTYGIVTILPEIGIDGTKLALKYTGSKFINLDNLWTPYCKLATLSSAGATPIYSARVHNSNLFTDLFYDPSMQTSGSLSYPVYPSALAIPGGLGTGSAYEPSNSLQGREQTINATRNLKIPRPFPYWDDWNPFINSGSIPGNAGKLNNYWVRGASVFLSTHTGSATLFSASVDRSSNTSSKVYSFELPLSINPYTNGTYYRDKYAVFSNAVANNIDIPSSYWGGGSFPGWRTIGVGPTSVNLDASTMTDAAKYNGYVYVLENDQTKDKDYSLKVVFRYSWARA